MAAPLVGIIANPVSARDIRRVIALAGGLQVTDRANMVLRILAGLAATGIERVLMMPERGGLRLHMGRVMERAERTGAARFPELSMLDMPVTATASDSARAARMLAGAGVAAIVVLGGDGTARAVVAECGSVPVAAVSTGTNNAFPEMREPTVTGLGVGLAATGRVPAAIAFRDNKLLEVRISGRREIALVDVAVVAERFVGSRAIWKAEGFRELFVTYAEPAGIGMSAVAGLLAPVSRGEPFGRRLLFGHPDTSARVLMAPIAPGLIEAVGIEAVETLHPDRPAGLSVPAGSLAFDGEREIAFSERDEVSVTLRAAAFRSIDVAAAMTYAAANGLLAYEQGPAQIARHRRGTA